MENLRLQILFEKFLGEEMSPLEIFELQELIQDERNQADLDELLTSAYNNPSLIASADYNKEEVFAAIQSKAGINVTPVIEMRSRRRWPKFVAAAIIILLATASYFIFFNTSKKIEIAKTPVQHDISAPAITKATIKLDDGKIIYLDSTGNGLVANQGAVSITKQSDGKISYNSQSNSSSPTGGGQEGAYNTLTNPRGSKVIDMTLSDGSRIWLNAESSLRYPVAFNSNERKVEITGEAYFEVAHDKSKPFKVSKGNTEVEVLGTHFNVNAYNDEDAIKVTLLEGSVKVSNNSSPLGEARVRLKPGQQAILSPTGGLQGALQLTTDNSVNLEQVMAWKNGLFKFDHTDLKVIMRQIARWYDVDVSYEGNVTEQLYNGDVPRNVNVSEVLRVLQYTGANFSIEGNKIIVRP